MVPVCFGDSAQRCSGRRSQAAKSKPEAQRGHPPEPAVDKGAKRVSSPLVVVVSLVTPFIFMRRCLATKVNESEINKVSAKRNAMIQKLESKQVCFAHVSVDLIPIEFFIHRKKSTITCLTSSEKSRNWAEGGSGSS